MSKELKIKDENDKEITLMFKSPDYEDLEEADQIYAAKASSMILQKGSKKLLSRQELDTFLKESKIWTDEDESKIQKLSEEISELLNEIRKGGQKASVGRKLCISVYEKRMEIVKISAKRQRFDDITIESFAENERNDYLVYACTYYKDTGTRYWESFEDMKNDKASVIYRTAFEEVYKLVYDIKPDFEKNLPEIKWLQKYGFIDNELRFVDRKTGQKVDKSGQPIQETEKKIQNVLDNLQGDIKEEVPFIDDETNEAIVVG